MSLSPEVPLQLASGQPALLHEALAEMTMHMDLAEPLEISPITVATFEPVFETMDQFEYETFLRYLLGQTDVAPSLPRDEALDQLAEGATRTFTEPMLRRLHFLEDMDDPTGLFGAFTARLGVHLPNTTEERAFMIKGQLHVILDRENAIAIAAAAAIETWPKHPMNELVIRHLCWEFTPGRYPALEARVAAEN